MASVAKEDTLIEAVRQALGDDTLQVTNARQLAGGAMHEWWQADASTDPVSRIVIRLAPPARDDAQKARNEFAVLSAASQRGVRVAKPLFVGENSIGQTFMVSERIDGDTNPRQLLMDPAYGTARRNIIHHLAQDLAVVHTIRPEDVAAPLRRPQEGEDALLFELDRQEEEYWRVRINPHPLIEWAFRWIRRNAANLRPRVRALHVVHGDLRTGNIMYNSEGLAAILDWEGNHIGEPEEDLSWYCTKVWRFNRRDLHAGGVADRETWLRAYEQAAGHDIDRDRLKLWEVLQNVRWAVICMMQANQFLSGIMPDSHEHGAIGRRAADTELEVMRLIGAV
jgi:aminoglycoside phosphotransferase (APT) family kinase protein